MYKTLFFLFAVVIMVACKNTNNESSSKKTSAFIDEKIQAQAIDSIKLRYGAAEAFRIERGVAQVANLWSEKDGSAEAFAAFCSQNFVPQGGKLDTLFGKLSHNFEVVWGNFLKMNIELMEPLHLDKGEITAIDEKFGSFNPSAHLTEDLFQNQVAFLVALNFPFYNLAEKNQKGADWTPKQWAEARMGDVFTSRVPAELQQKASDAATTSDTYISEYNICMDKLVDDNGKPMFEEGLKLITHWGLRDELKSNYGMDGGQQKQEMIFEVMKRIVDQSIPSQVINNPEFTWNPVSNAVTKDGKKVETGAEPDTRYQMLLGNFKAMLAIDAYSPQYPTFIKRKFESEMELTQEEVEKLFINFVSSPQVKQVASLISKRLGRQLRPYDIWYNGFKASSGINESDLDKKTKALYPNPLAVQNDMPNMLKKLGFTPADASFIASKVQVDGSRGAGHAQGAAMKSEKARLRTRIAADGMNYKGYNIAVHEFGHNVEQTITLHNVPDYMLNGVPNTAFTEALAFIFQKRDLELLGFKETNPDKETMMVLDHFWACYEIMGVSLVDMNVWKWLYEHPDATPAQLKEAVLKISKEVWNTYYADVFGSKDEAILAIYSHMIDAPLYLSAYPIGHLIDFQIEKFLVGKDFATEVKRMYSIGRVAPQVWMKNAVGEELSEKPLLEATSKAVQDLAN